MSKSKLKYVTKFNKSYTNEFPSIIASRKGSTYAFCSDCACDILIAHGGKNDILLINGQKHKNTEIFANYTKKKFPADDDSVIRAEAYLTAILIEHNLPINCADHAGPLFCKMFPNDGIAKKYAAGRTKTTAIINEMATMEKESVVEILKESPFSVSTDGSNKSDVKLYPLVVTYYNEKSMIIESTLMSVPNLEGDSTDINIANLILRELNANDIPFENCLSLGADNAPVMIGEKTAVAGVLKKEIGHLAVIGCACHLINLATQKGAVVIPDKIDEFLIDIFFNLEKSAKRKYGFRNSKLCSMLSKGKSGSMCPPDGFHWDGVWID
nr:uncharacterized protein LOC122272173 [Parasteatoda tepidariorum]